MKTTTGSTFLLFAIAPTLAISSLSYGANTPSEPACMVQTDSSGTLTRARSLFFSQCDHHVLTDCDPVESGGWQCSSEVIGVQAPGYTSSENSTPATSPVAVELTPNQPVEPAAAPTAEQAPEVPIAQGTDSDVCYTVSNELDHARQLFAQQCSSFTRRDCDPRDGGQWVCSSDAIHHDTQFAQLTNNEIPIVQIPPAYPDVIPDTAPPVVEPPTTAPAPQQPVIPTEPPATPSNGSNIGRLGANDLLVLHYDNCPDRDDGHAIPAGKAIVENLSINHVLVANGTCGDAIRDRFNHDSFTVMNAVWGNDYLNAFDDNANATTTAALAWASVLNNGANVWVAEGGQSDFTANIVRRIEADYPNADLKRIHVIQHSAGSTAYNEMFTNSNNLSYLQARTSYQPITNGNVGGNGTADLNEQSSYFVNIARSGRFSAEWDAAFVYLQPDCAIRTENCKLDFSDTVEVLYIVGDQQTLTVNDFANNYLR